MEQVRSQSSSSFSAQRKAKCLDDPGSGGRFRTRCVTQSLQQLHSLKTSNPQRDPNLLQSLSASTAPLRPPLHRQSSAAPFRTGGRSGPGRVLEESWKSPRRDSVPGKPSLVPKSVRRPETPEARITWPCGDWRGPVAPWRERTSRRPPGSACSAAGPTG